MLDRRPRFPFVLTALLGLLVMGACGGPSTLQSTSPTAPPTIDGTLSEWGGALTYVNDEPVSMGVVPTDSLLYVALTTQDQRLIRSIAKNGLIVWVDPAGGEQRTFGVQYPLGLRVQRAGRRGPRGAGASGASRPTATLDQLALKELAVIRHDSIRTRIPAKFSSGLRAQATIDRGALVYELAIPVGAASENPTERAHGLRTALGPTVGIGLQTPEPDDASNVQMPSQGVPSVTGRRRGNRRSRRNRQRQRRRPAQEADLPSLDLWTRVVTGGS